MLREQIDDAQRLIKTDTVQITIGEIGRMYEEAELDILPDFQRLFRWSIGKKTSFIESIFIGIPIPPAFAYENADGTWELIDGLQRISTVLEFMGLLRDPDRQGAFLESTLVSAKYLTDLDGTRWSEGSERNLSRSLKLLFRRARLDFQVLKHPSDPRTKFDLFQRLNRGGAYANAQEVRSCSMVLANVQFTRAIKRLSSSESFKAIFRLSQSQIDNQENVEYAVRILVHTFRNYENDSDVQEFLDRSIIDILTTEDENRCLRKVSWSVDTLYRILGEAALLPTPNAIEGVANRFSLRALESIVVGVAKNRTAIRALDDTDRFIRERVQHFWQEPDVLAMSASGLRGTTRLLRTVPFGARYFNPNA